MNWVSITPVVLSRTRRTSVSVGTYSGDMMRLMFSKKLGKEEEGEEDRGKGARRARRNKGKKKESGREINNLKTNLRSKEKSGITYGSGG